MAPPLARTRGAAESWGGGCRSRALPYWLQGADADFSRDRFTQAQALGWARDHGFRAQKLDVEPNTLRVRQESPADFERMRTITLRPGIKAVVGWKRC